MSRLFSGVAIATLAAACALAAPSDVAAQTAQDAQLHRACAALGLDPGQAPFQLCTRSLRASLPSQPASTTIAPTNAAATTNGVLPSRAAVQQACSIIGLSPATAQFDACVTNLQATLFRASQVGTD
jgi:hypothetical protein